MRLFLIFVLIVSSRGWEGERVFSSLSAEWAHHLKPVDNSDVSGPRSFLLPPPLSPPCPPPPSQHCSLHGREGQAFINRVWANASNSRAATCSAKKVGGVVKEQWGGRGRRGRGTYTDGDKVICVASDGGLPRPRGASPTGKCVVYSLGSMGDFTFERAVVERFGCEVFTFDCTIGNGTDVAVPAGVEFHPWCVGERDEVKQIPRVTKHSADILKQHATKGTAQFFTLSTLMANLRHQQVDLLKMDIERR